MTAIYHEDLKYDTLDIMVDIDDVVMPWFETVDAKCREFWGPSPMGPCRTWQMHDHYDRTREEWEDVVIAATAEGLYTDTDPFPGAVEAVNRLRWYGHRVHIVTARGFMANGENIRRWTGEYLHRFGIGHDSLTFSKDKASAQRDLGLVFDFAVDDSLRNFEDLSIAGVKTYLHDAPHNRPHVHVPPSSRVSSLWEFANIVLEETRYADYKPHWEVW